jgi:hypothetical protein
MPLRPRWKEKQIAVTNNEQMTALLRLTVHNAYTLAGVDGLMPAVRSYVRNVAATYGIDLTDQQEQDVLRLMDDAGTPADQKVDAMMGWIETNRSLAS